LVLFKIFLWSWKKQSRKVQARGWLSCTHHCCVAADAAVPPWVGYNEEEQMKAQILELSAVRENHPQPFPSQRAKLPESDIEHDHSLTSASILCFPETWLTPELSSPVILGHHQVIRSDRMSGDNKGGVLISIPANIQASNQTEFSCSGVIIEALSTTLYCPTDVRSFSQILHHGSQTNYQRS